MFSQFYSGPLAIEMASVVKVLHLGLLWTLLLFENILGEDEFHTTAAIHAISYEQKLIKVSLKSIISKRFPIFIQCRFVAIVPVNFVEEDQINLVKNHKYLHPWIEISNDIPI